MTAPGPIVPQPGIDEIAPYVPGRSTLDGTDRIIKLSSNETPFGPSPRAVEAFRAASASLERYPDGSATALREAIGQAFGLNPERIVCGAGSDELLSLLATAYLGPGDEGIYTEHGFLVYKIAIQTSGAAPVIAPERDYCANADAILEAVTERTKAVFIANPNNPTGTYMAFDEVQRLREALPKHVLLVLDAAYAEYVKRNDYEAGIELVATSSNTVMTRTFSKVFGLASLRLGWAYCPEDVAKVLNKIRGPFNVSGPAIAAGVAAIQDKAHIERSVARNSEGLAWLTAEIEKLGLQVTPSAANFLLVHFPEKKRTTAAEADRFLCNKGIILRRLEAYGLPGALRLTVGTADENKAVMAALDEFMASAGTDGR